MDKLKDGHRGSDVRCPVCDELFWQREDGRPKTCSRQCARRREWQGKPIPVRLNAPSGYMWHLVPNGHPHGVQLHKKSRGRYILEHRFVMEGMLGRHLKKHERVHHKNGKRADNRRQNLELWMVGKKDPAGQRNVDLLIHEVEQLPDEERAKLLAYFKL